jgi:hypothetical protein
MNIEDLNDTFLCLGDNELADLNNPLTVRLTNHVDNQGLVTGEPESDMLHWHHQSEQNSCAVAAQEFVLDEMTGRDFTEAELIEEALSKGWYDPQKGTELLDVGNLLEAHGIGVERRVHCTLVDLHRQLAQNHNILVVLDSDELYSYSPHEDNSDRGEGANHAVQVIALDYTDPNESFVLLNDPGNPNGRGIRVSVDRFMDAWEDSNYFMVSTA